MLLGLAGSFISKKFVDDVEEAQEVSAPRNPFADTISLHSENRASVQTHMYHESTHDNGYLREGLISFD